jgi:hypothetical protein
MAAGAPALLPDADEGAPARRYIMVGSSRTALED